MDRKKRKLAKIVSSLRRNHIEVSENATNILFVSNSSHLVGVPFECLESLFRQFDPNCAFTVYPNSKSYSLVHFSDVYLASSARKVLDDTRPECFPEENPTITLLFVKEPPQTPKLGNGSKLPPNGLKIVPNFISAQFESELEQFVEGCLAGSTNIDKLKNRRVFHFGYAFDYNKNNALDKAPPIPPIIDGLINDIFTTFSCHSPDVRPNQITVNVYEPGQGIPLHLDTHSAFEERVYSLSLLSDVVMEFRDCANSARRNCVHLPRRSLLLLTGDARYRHKHGILTRHYDVHPMSNQLLKRERRISITFRTVRRVPCQCSYIEFCDWDRGGQLRIPSGEHEGRQLEQQYVAEVYEAIAPHFDLTRFSNWRCVVNFLVSLPRGSTLLDVGCGNGKYLLQSDGLTKFGCDISWNLLRITSRKGCASVFCADALQLPIRNGAFDAVISVAVIHHFSTRRRRVRALSELLRVVRPGGRALVTAWALEQFSSGATSVPSIYASKMRANKTNEDDDAGDDLQAQVSSNIAMLRIHDGKQFKQQDLLVPWSSSGDQRKDDSTGGEQEQQKQQKDFFRYYHLFVESEFRNLVDSEFSNCCELESEFCDEGNWVIVLRKKENVG
uniref:Alkylated DNA repair protein alkB homolog 8 n=1 Tax=Globodera rostochiensis TaxID=31243 RepID=A0A914I4N5_GLORO